MGTTDYRLATKSQLTDMCTLPNQASHHCLWPGGADPVNRLVRDLGLGIQRDTPQGSDRRPNLLSSGGQQ